MVASIDRFRDIHQHAASVRDWRQTYSQLTPGPLRSSLMQLSKGAFHVFRECINQRVVQHGQAPMGKVCFAVPLALPGAVRMQGREADLHSLFVLRGGEEFVFHMPQGADLLALTFEAGSVEQALARDGRQTLAALSRQPVLRVQPQRLAQIRATLLQVFCQAITDPHLLVPQAMQEELERSLLDALLGLAADPACDAGHRLGSSPASFIVEKCHGITLTDTGRRPEVVELCQRLRISRRTLQNSFRSVAQTTPVHYIRCIRLNGVRRQLMATAPEAATIAQVASDWGFTHLSHFAAEYEELFGELPSRTRRSRSARPAGALLAY
ncbi:helix-turn-helix domain-containing protein [Variovorax sp. GB1P17]|uniref:helix-turn-helix domain-containing protein n=1 Tax=Variovorax sp. GB1P17 TaxID=3443740 RepID=UPI003F4815F3